MKVLGKYWVKYRVGSVREIVCVDCYVDTNHPD